jgi:hypothetical protein
MERTLKTDFLTVTRPWLEKVANTKDLKPLRKADWKLAIDALVAAMHEITSLLPELTDTQSDFVIGPLLEGTLPQIRSKIITSNVGGKAIRQDIWRRLLWIEITMGLHPHLMES